MKVVSFHFGEVSRMCSEKEVDDYQIEKAVETHLKLILITVVTSLVRYCWFYRRLGCEVRKCHFCGESMTMVVCIMGVEMHA